VQLPNLSFPGIARGARQPLVDLLPLVYLHGSRVKSNEVQALIKKGHLGTPVEARIPLLGRIHEEASAMRAGGTSDVTVEHIVKNFRRVFTWAEDRGLALTLESIEDVFLKWTDHLYERCRVAKDLQLHSANGQAAVVSTVLDRVLDRQSPLISTAKVSNRFVGKALLGPEAEKQNLTQALAFGAILLDISDALTADAIYGTLPVRIPLRNGQELVEWSSLESTRREHKDVSPSRVRQREAAREKGRAAWEAEHSHRTRSALINLRVEAELHIFISQTGMNLAQALKLEVGRFGFVEYLDGYRVRRYKGRRWGEVEFEIFSEYKVIFERFLEWRKKMFPDASEGRLFCFLSRGRHADSSYLPGCVSRRCRQLKASYVSPQRLRSTRVNWLRRRTGDDDLTAEMAQHSKQTFLKHYDRPNAQVAMIEVARFHRQNDPAIAPPGPGLCLGIAPTPTANAPKGATPPNCITPAGCLFCEQHRDVDSQDHVWSLASFRHLKLIEQSSWQPAERTEPQQSPPSAAAIDRLTEKLKYFEASSAVRAEWVREALRQVEEEDFHPMWDGFIRLRQPTI
jgi:hypothetical protein